MKTKISLKEVEHKLTQEIKEHEARCGLLRQDGMEIIKIMQSNMGVEVQEVQTVAALRRARECVRNAIKRTK